MTTIFCGDCGETFQVKEAKIGHQYTCPVCFLTGIYRELGSGALTDGILEIKNGNNQVSTNGKKK